MKTSPAFYPALFVYLLTTGFAHASSLIATWAERDPGETAEWASSSQLIDGLGGPYIQMNAGDTVRLTFNDVEAVTVSYEYARLFVYVTLVPAYYQVYLPNVETVQAPQPTRVPAFDPLDFGEAFTLSLFENNFSEDPFYSVYHSHSESHSRTWIPFTTGILPFPNEAWEPVYTAWEDGQGAIALTLHTGSIALSRVNVMTSNGRQALYGNAAAVPEPAAAVLLLLGLATFSAARRGRAR